MRRNAPYRGNADGLTTALRRELPASRYEGIELELNQRLIASAAQRRALAAALAALLPDNDLLHERFRMAVSALESMVRSFASGHPDAAARALEGLEPRAAAQLLQQLPTRIAAPVTERLSPDSAAVILSLIGAEGSRELLGSLPSRQAAAILHHLEDAVREAALSGLEPDRGKAIRDLLRYSPDTAGGMMDMRLTSLPIDLSVREAISALRRARRDTLYYLYVTDRVGKLIGVLDMRELLLASPRDPLESLVKREIVTVPVDMPSDEVASLIQRRRFVALPVVDRDGHLLGVVKPDEVLEAFQQEAFGDLQKMVGAGEDERALSPVSVVVSKRLPWLYVNLGTAFLAATVVGLFEHIIDQVTALAVLMPVVAGQGGNTGAQSLAVVMRGIALRELLPGSTARLVRKEMLGALLNGLAVALATGFAVWLWDGRLGLVLVIALAMVVNMTAAGLFGAAIPLVPAGARPRPRAVGVDLPHHRHRRGRFRRVSGLRAAVPADADLIARRPPLDGARGRDYSLGPVPTVAGLRSPSTGARPRPGPDIHPRSES